MNTITGLRQFREGKSLDEASTYLGVNKTTLLRWERGDVLIPHDRLIEIERITGISRKVLRPDLAALFVDSAPEPEAVA